MNKLPQLTFDFIEWFEDQDTREKTLVEFGSGDSTIYFSQKFDKVITCEDSPYWLDRLSAANLKNVEAHILNHRFYKDNFESIQNADYILVDNNPHDFNYRFYVAQVLIRKVNYQNILILDNGNWNGDAYFYLRTKYRHYQDFIGINPRGDRTVTTVFSERI